FSATLARRQLFDLVVVLDRLYHGRHRLEHACLLADLLFDLLSHGRVLPEEVAAVVLALAEPVAAVDVPGAGFLDHAVDHAQLQHFALARDALAVQDVEFGVAEGRRDLVLHHLDARLRADHFLALLDGADAADVHAHRGVELERVAAGGGLRVAEHDADL